MYRIIIIAESDVNVLKETFESGGFRLIQLKPSDDAIQALRNIASTGGAIDAICFYDPNGIYTTTKYAHLVKTLRSLPATTTFDSGLKLSALPIVSFPVASAAEDLVELAGTPIFEDELLETAVTEDASKSLRWLHAGGRYYLGKSSKTRAKDFHERTMMSILDFKHQVLKDFDQRGIAITFEGGEFRLHKALTRKKEQETEYFYWNKMFKPHTFFIEMRKAEMNAVLLKYMHLIRKSNVQERELQDFFETHPTFLLNDEFENLWPRFALPIGHNEIKYYCDFLLKPLQNPERSSNWKVVELKKPSDPVVGGPRLHRGFSRAVTHAMTQLKDYASRFERNPQYLQKKLGHPVTHPSLALVIGLNRREDQEIIAREQSRQADVKLVTYDDIEESQMRRVSALLDFGRIVA